MKVPLALLLLNVALVLTNDLAQFSDGNKEFSANIYKELAADHDGNFLGCPMSTQIVLSMVHAGARHETADQLAKGLSLPNDNAKINAMMKAVLPVLTGVPKINTLKVVNKMYVHKDLKISDSFKSTVVDVFKSAINNINFAKNVDAAAEMNDWVSEQTDGHIKQLIEPADIDEETRAVLLNSVYFQATWAKRFYEDSTKKANFYTSKVGNVEVDMMDTTGSFQYHECGQFKAKFIKMPYVGADQSMVVVLPNEKDGLPLLEANIHEVLGSQKYDWKKVHVKFPKFEMDTTIKFIPILQKLGIVAPFKPNADLSGITADGTPLYITQVVQKNHMEVNEKGTIAASATAAIVGVGSSFNPEPPKEFFADHPFIFYIESGAGILFVGRYEGH